jgi:hypothetical protein
LEWLFFVEACSLLHSHHLSGLQATATDINIAPDVVRRAATRLSNLELAIEIAAFHLAVELVSVAERVCAQSSLGEAHPSHNIVTQARIHRGKLVFSCALRRAR